MQLEYPPIQDSIPVLHNGCMLDVHAIKAQDLGRLSPQEMAALAQQMLAHIGEQSKRIDSQAQAIKWRDAKIESITFQLARLKAWKFGARTEAMNAEQRALFEETFYAARRVAARRRRRQRCTQPAAPPPAQARSPAGTSAAR